MAERDSDKSLVELLATLASDIPDLFRNEIRLLRAEASEVLRLLQVALGRLLAGSAIAVGAVGVLLAALVSWTGALLVALGVDRSLAGSLAPTLVAAVAGLVAWALFASAVRNLRAARSSIDDSMSALGESTASIREKR